MSLRLVSLALLLAGCGGDAFSTCYAQMTNNGAAESVEHIEHCDMEAKLMHASADACRTDHKDHKIRADLLDAHCASVH